MSVGNMSPCSCAYCLSAVLNISPNAVFARPRRLHIACRKSSSLSSLSAHATASTQSLSERRLRSTSKAAHRLPKVLVAFQLVCPRDRIHPVFVRQELQFRNLSLGMLLQRLTKLCRSRCHCFEYLAESCISRVPCPCFVTSRFHSQSRHFTTQFQQLIGLARL